jgi:hypothetical protein
MQYAPLDADTVSRLAATAIPHLNSMREEVPHVFAGDGDKAALAVGMILALAFASHLHTAHESLAEPIVRAANNVLSDIALQLVKR